MSSRLPRAVAWLSDPATYPLFVSIGAGVVLCAGCSGRYLFRSPDVTWNKGDRSSHIREARQTDIRWFSHKTGFARGADNAINSNPEVLDAIDRWNKVGGWKHNGFSEE